MGGGSLSHSMKLDKIIRKWKLSRRELLKILGYSGARLTLGGNIPSSIACKGSPAEPEPLPTQVTLRATFFNHTKGSIGEKTYTGSSGSPLILKTSDVYASNVDQNRIVVREAANGGVLGKRIGYSRNGEVQATFPSQNRDYDVFLMNQGPTTSNDYAKIDVWVDKGGGILVSNPAAKWCREDIDGYTGPEAPINDAFNDLDGSIKHSWANYGRYDKMGNGGDFSVGYCNGYGAAGRHSKHWAGVDPIRCAGHVLRLKVFLSELFEMITQTDDLAGANTFELITNPATGHLNEIGRDLFAYAHVKDDKTASDLPPFNGPPLK